MPRDYKKKIGSRDYKNYEEKQLNDALADVVDGKKTIRAAAEVYKIPYGTLYNKYKGQHIKKPGAQTIFSESEELAILKAAAKCAEWGYPLSLLDLRYVAKAYLDRQGRVVHRFNNNVPGVEWAYSLLKRHKNNYSQRVSTNIKKARANVSPETLNSYFDNLGNVIKDIPPSNIFNYDESNMSDDPGKKLGIYKRGVKYPEKVMNHSKSATTVMICGSADGVLLPPYVIYKSTHLYDTWKEGGPRGTPCCNQICCSGGTRYNRTASGWIDTVTFRDWFCNCFLPHAKRLPGRKVIIGDNLSSHMDVDVLNLCEQNQIDFVCLVPNSTHLTQPLDVGFFRPMKSAWRTVLTKWKLRNAVLSSVPKDNFPSLLKTALSMMDSVIPKPNAPFSEINSAIKRNLMSSFKATGIYPFNREAVMRRLPSQGNSDLTEDADQNAESVLTDYLREQRFGGANTAPRRRTRLNVPPGASASTAEPAAPLENREESVERSNTLDTDDDHLDQPCGSTDTARVELMDTDAVAEDSDDPEPMEDVESEISLGRFVLAKFYTARKKKVYRYVCRIIDITPLVVEGFKSWKTKKKFKRVIGDISEIEENDIIAFLPRPKQIKSDENVETISFNYDIDILEMQ